MMVRVPLGYCSRVLQPTCPSFRRRLASWTCCDASWTICTSACCSTTAAWAAASPRRRGRALMRFPTQFPSPRVLFSRFDCPIWMVAFFFLSTHLRTTSTTEISTSRCSDYNHVINAKRFTSQKQQRLSCPMLILKETSSIFHFEN